MTIRQALRCHRILDTVRMARKVRAIRTDFETVRFRTTIEGLRGKRMGHGDQGHVRLLAESEPQAKRPVRGEVADEKVRSG